jgi:hypothetical protein
MNVAVDRSAVAAALTRDPRWHASAALVGVGVVFLSGYWAANRWTRVRSDVGRAVFDWERAIPFVEWTIVPYLSLIAFFAAAFYLCRTRAELTCLAARLLAVLALSLACYALWPLQVTFDKPATTGVPGLLFDLLHAFDLPYNRAPSLHISVAVILWVALAQRLQGALRAALAGWFVLIGISVLTTYQHHVIDVPAGFVAGCVSVRTFSIAGLTGLRVLVRGVLRRLNFSASTFNG